MSEAGNSERMRSLHWVGLIGIVLIALAVRVCWLGRVPAGFFIDEAAVGVNARLIIEGGIDQYARRWPLFFRSLDDYKCPVYIYSTALLGLGVGVSEYTVRLPAVIWGVAGVVVAFWLGREVWRSASVGLATALLVSLCPWHIHYSRIGWQAITLSVVFSAATLLAIRWLRRPALGAAIASGFLLALSLYTYSPAKLLVAGCGLALCWIALKRYGAGNGAVIGFVISFMLTAAPFVVSYAVNASFVNLRLMAIRLPVELIPGAYWAHLQPSFLFGGGNGNLVLSPGSGLLHWYLVPLFALGSVFAVVFKSRAGLATLAIVFFAPLLGSFTYNYPHPARTLTVVPFLHVIAAGGLLWCNKILRSDVQRIAALLVSLAIVAASAGRQLRHYVGSYATESANQWGVGAIDSARAAQANAASNEPIYLLDYHYIHWMYVETPPAARIIEHRRELARFQSQYDHLDRRGKFSFLRARVVPDLYAHTAGFDGIWILPAARVPELDSLAARGNRVVEEIFSEGAFAVHRVTGPQ